MPQLTEKEAAKYMRRLSRSLQFHEGFVNPDWQENGFATVFISRKMKSGNYILCVFLVDTFCVGVKDSIYLVNLDSEEYVEKKEKIISGYNTTLMPAEEEYIHNLIYGAIDYAETYGFFPRGDFAISENILNPEMITDGIDDLEFGKDGKPFFISGPYDNRADINRIIATLKRTAGEGNFHFIRLG